MAEVVAALVWGVDTLVLTYLAPVPHQTIDLLTAAKADARDKLERGSKEPTSVRLADRDWIVRPQSAPPYRFMLHGPEEMDVRIAGRATLHGDTPTVIIELRAAYLWHRGYGQAARDAQELARAILGSPEHCRETAARIDLCADFQGWLPEGTDDEKKRLVRRVRKGLHQHGAGAYFTGYSIGLGLPLQARLYDKTDEIARSDKTWFRDLWTTAGYDPALPVWRLELQARSEALEQMGLRTDWVGNIEGRLDELWRFTFGHPDWRPELETDAARSLRALKTKRSRLARKGQFLEAQDEHDLVSLELEAHDERRDHGAWVSLRDPLPSREPSDWPIAPAWRALQRVTFEAPDARRGLRMLQREAHIENQVRQVRGLFASIGALSGVKPRDGGSERERAELALWDCYHETQRRLLILEGREPHARGLVERLEEKAVGLRRLHVEKRSAPLPLAPWKPARDPVKTIPWSPDDRLYGPAQLNVRSVRTLRPLTLEVYGDGPDEERLRRKRARSLRFDLTAKWAQKGGTA